MEKSATGMAGYWGTDDTIVVDFDTEAEIPPPGTKVRVTWEVPESVVTCCDLGKAHIHWWASASQGEMSPTYRRSVNEQAGEEKWYMRIFNPDLGREVSYPVVACPFCGKELP